MRNVNSMAVEERAVCYVLATRAAHTIPPHPGYKSPNVRGAVKFLQEYGFEVGEAVIRRIVRGHSELRSEFVKAALELDSALFSTNEALESYETKKACLKIYHMLPKKGQSPLLTYQEEVEVVSFIQELAERGMAPSKAQLEDIILQKAFDNHSEKIAVRKAKERGLGPTVVKTFMDRWGYILASPSADPDSG